MNNHHWTSDADLVERFVLDRLDPSERALLEGHLSMCDTCRAVVHAEEQLAAGIRRAGKNQLKDRLKNRIVMTERVHTPWVRILSAAAVIVILTGIGIYYNWFATTHPGDDLIMVGTEGVAEEDTGQRTDVGKPATREDRQSLRGPAADSHVPQPPSTRESTPAVGQSGRQPSTEQDVSKKANASQHQTRARREVVAEEMEHGKVQGFGDESAERGLWVQGTLLLLVQGTKEEDDARNRARREQRGGDLLSVPADRGTRMKSTVAVQPSLAKQQVNVSQRLGVQFGKPQEAVQTLIEYADGSLQLTLFVDEPLAQEDLDRASYVQVTDDSLVVFVGKQAIAYKLPPDWQERLQQRGATQK